MRHLLALLCIATVSLPFGSIAATAPTYKVMNTIQIGGTGGWDYLTADAAARKLYVSHGTQVEVFDLDSQSLVGHIGGMKRIHGIAIASDLGMGFISDGGSNEVAEFQLKDRSVAWRVKTGTNPDGLVYDSYSKRVFVFNGRSNDATVIDAKSGTVTGTIPIGGKPEFPVTDAKGSIYVNIEDKSEILRIDAMSLEVTARWSVAPCEEPSGLAFDAANRRLFAVCGNKMMAVVDADSGKVVATPAIGEGPDAAAFDAKSKLAFASNGQTGTLTVIQQKGKDEYTEGQSLTTARGARTMALDEKTHNLYLVTASFGEPPPATPNNPHPRPEVRPGSFKILVAGPQ